MLNPQGNIAKASPWHQGGKRPPKSQKPSSTALGPGGDNGRAKPGRKGKKASGSMGVVKVGG